MPKKILFVCHGNICRSPMAEFVMKDMARKAGLEDEIFVDSKACRTDEIGSDTYYGTKNKLREEGVPFTPRQARQITLADYDKYDYAEIEFTDVDPANAEDPKAINPFDVKIGDYYYPNSMYGFYMWFKNHPEMVTSKVQITVNHGETLRVGLRKDVGITNDCLTFDTFQIKYLSGDQFKDEETGIEDVTPVKVEKSNVLYNTAGQIVDDSYKGIVIDSEGNKFIKK